LLLIIILPKNGCLSRTNFAVITYYRAYKSHRVSITRHTNLTTRRAFWTAECLYDSKTIYKTCVYTL